MNSENPSTPEGPNDLAARLAELLAEARAQGVDVTGLVGAAPGLTFGEQLALRLPTLRRDHKGTYATWAPYLQRLAAGLPGICPCTCPACATGPCPCSTDSHADGCTPEVDIDCASRMTAHGGGDVRTVTRHHLTDAAWWARRQAMQRTLVRIATRESAGRVQHDHDGRGAQEAMVQACRWLWEEMRRDGVVAANVAKDVKMPTR